VDTADFDFELPSELIAQSPPPRRGDSRLLVLDRESGAIADRQFRELPDVLRPGDLLVTNDTRVVAARLLGKRLPGGGGAEALLVRRLTDDAAAQDSGPAATVGASSTQETWEALVHPGQRLKDGSRLEFGGGDAPLIHAEVLARLFHGRRRLRLWTDGADLTEAIERVGHVPLPPYIKRPDAPADRDRYQTVYARVRGSIAAPTAGLHFTPDILSALAARGVEHVSITLHVGYGTFRPVRAGRVEDHQMDAEHFEVSAASAAAIDAALAGGRRVIAVGTTTTRALESLPRDERGHVRAGSGDTDLFMFPGYRYRVVSGLITNFHLPRSSLLMLVSAFAGRDPVLRAYRHAVEHRYRFYSYGDAMFVG
jgi:S-adenosylmethionine:tRNA ribosyltransferase-isomerase